MCRPVALGGLHPQTVRSRMPYNEMIPYFS